MKKIYAISGVAVMLMLLFYAGTCVTNRGTIKINYTENKECYKYDATYQREATDAVIAHINEWAGQAAERSGSLAETMKLKFSDGISCRVHARGREVEIIADRAENNAASIVSLKKECKTIDSLIMAKSR